MDTELYFNWLAGAVLTGNYDGFEQNYALYEQAGTMKYGIAPWDYEGTWGRNCYGKPCSADLVRIQGYNGLTRRLLGFKDWKKQYAETLERILASEFTAEKIGPAADALLERISVAVRQDASRAGTLEAFRSEGAYIRAYVKKRRESAALRAEKMARKPI